MKISGLWLFLMAALLVSSCSGNAAKGRITAEAAYGAVSKYCHETYDWSPAAENPSVMGVEMGRETDSAYLVVFRSYTGTLVNFYVDKTTGSARVVEYVPALDIREEVGTVELPGLSGTPEERH